MHFNGLQSDFVVSTHSRVEAAAFFLGGKFAVGFSFNTQPRGGGCNKQTENTNE